MNKIIVGVFFSFLVLSCKEQIKEEPVITEVESEIIDTISVSDSVQIIDAPSFELELVDGGTKSLADYKGKLVFMDIWATWCGPCLAQIPYFKILHEKYKNEPIVFVSVSIDAEKDKEKWRKMVKDKGLVGDQLFAGVSSQFPLDYKVEFLPCFILISPEGKILIHDAPQVINEDGDAVNDEIVKILDYSLNNIKKAAQ